MRQVGRMRYEDRRRERHAGDRRALLAPARRAATARSSGASRGSSTACATGGDRALARFARRFDGVTGADRGDRARRCATAPRASTPAVRRAIAQAARNIARGGRRARSRSTSTSQVGARRHGRAARRAARPRRLLRAGRTLPAALLAADDGRPGARRRRPRGHRRLPAAGAGRDGGGARSRRRRGCSASAARTRSRRSPTAPTTVPRVDKIVGPGNRYVAAAKALVARRLRDRLLRRPDRDRHRRRRGPAGVDRRRSHRAGRARPRRARDLHHVEPAARASASSRRSPSAAPAARSSSSRSRANGAVIVTRDADEAMALANRFAPEHLVVDREALARRPLTAGAVFVGPYTAQAAGDYATGSNHVLPTAGAARFRGGLTRRRFRARDVGAARHARRGWRGSRRRFCRWRAPKGSRRTPSRSRSGSQSHEPSSHQP